MVYELRDFVALKKYCRTKQIIMEGAEEKPSDERQQSPSESQQTGKK